MFNFLIFVLGAALMFGMGLRSVLARRKLCQKGEKVTARVAGTVQGRDGQAYVLEFDDCRRQPPAPLSQSRQGQRLRHRGRRYPYTMTRTNLEKMYIEGDQSRCWVPRCFTVVLAVVLLLLMAGFMR